MLVQPADFGVSQQKDAAQDDLGDAFRMGLRIGESQRAAPGSAEYQPALDAQMLAQPLDVRDQVPGGVLDQAGARPAAAAAALIEHHDAIVLRIEELPRALVGARARAAVQKHGGFAGGIAAFLVVDFMDVRNAQVTVAERFDRRIQFAARQSRRRHSRGGARATAGAR